MTARLKQTLARLAFAVAVLLPLPALSDQSVVSLFAAKTTTGASSTVFFVGAQTQDSYAFQVVWTGTAVTTLDASLDGTNWYTTATWGASDNASKVIITAPILGGTVYRLNVSSCSSCSVNAKTTASGAAQVTLY